MTSPFRLSTLVVSIRTDVPATMAVVAGLLLLSISGAGSAGCPSGTVSLDVAAAFDLQSLTDAMDCTGEGYYNVSWHGNIDIDQTIEVFGEKTVSVTGYGVSTDEMHDTRAVVGAGGTTGLFIVSDGSTLKLNHLVLDGGYGEEGGAVVVRDSSSLHVFSCIFVNNAASAGGETLHEATRCFQLQ